MNDGNDKNAVVVIPQREVPQPVPISIPFEQLKQMAAAVARSNLFGIKTPDQALVLMLIAQAEGRHPALAARDYDIIQGRPSKKSEAMLRDFLMAGGKVTWHEYSDEKADATFWHPFGGEVRITWDMKRVETAGLSSKENYRKYPRAMLRSRVVSEGVRTVCPMATSGMYVPEEVQDFQDTAPAAKSVATAKQVQPTLDLEYRIKGVASLKGKLLSEVHPADLAKAVSEAKKYAAVKDGQGAKVNEDILEFIDMGQQELKIIEAFGEADKMGEKGEG